MTEQTIRVGISTCPNDTFAFHGLLTGKVKTPGVHFEFELLDVQQLNEKLISGELEVAKGSFHAGLLISEETGVLDAGSALGFGNGPLLLSSRTGQSPSDVFQNDSGETRQAIVLCPGEHTTAHLLYRVLYPDTVPQSSALQSVVIQQTVFSEIMPLLIEGTADFGVCIHEGRFTWQDEGLGCVADLGEMWEQRTGMPLPLGGIFARHSLGTETHQILNDAIRRSIEYGREHRDEALETMRQHAQELSDEVIFAHVDLYVNEWTLSLRQPLDINRPETDTSDGQQVTGQDSLSVLHQYAKIAGVIGSDHPPLQVLG